VACVIPLFLLLLAIPALAADSYLFTSFRKNGETGVFFALSGDGLKFTPLKNNQPWIPPQHAGMLMRDPYLVQGPDRVWHLLWTWGWGKGRDSQYLRMGHATSNDLITWSAQQEIRLFDDEPNARNVWAPEMVWDAKRHEWLIFWATTITGRFPKETGESESGYNHRMYAITTRDFQTFTKPRLFLDPGYNVIDLTLARDGKLWRAAIKDERLKPEMKRLRFATAPDPAGPWSTLGEPTAQSWIEGPSMLRIGKHWIIYYDRYRLRKMGALKTRDFQSFTEISDQLSFPDDHRHGTVVRIDAKTAAKLRAVQ
jgi:hypothetical protein